MPGKKTSKPKSSAGESGLNTETTSGGQAPDHRMNSEQSSVATPKLPGQETPEEMLELAAFEALLGDSPPQQEIKDPLHESIDVEKEDNEDKDNEEEDAFLLPRIRKLRHRNRRILH